MRARAVGILVNDRKEVLLMLRRKHGREYATLPGGGIELGETPAVACAREILEEVNFVVQVREEPCVLEHQGNREHYFRVGFQSGEMRLGDGPESAVQSANNVYTPVWVHGKRLNEVNLLPEAIRPVVLGLIHEDRAQRQR